MSTEPEFTPEQLAQLQVIQGVEIDGRINTEDHVLLENIRHSIRRGHPQVKQQQGIQSAGVAIVCGGPSLESTLPELRQLIAEGHKVVTVNGAYSWCIEHNIIPSMQIVMDARATNARFLEPALPRCHYLLASQCHPLLWDAVADRPNVWIYHVGVNEDTVESKQVLDRYYLGQWHSLAGGTTVGTRAIVLLRTLGYYRMEIFGMDSCWLDGGHHAYAQPENESDRRIKFVAHPEGHPEMRRVFYCAPWHIQQLQDFLQLIRFHSHHFLLNVHGDGLLAYTLNSSCEVQLREEQGVV